MPSQEVLDSRAQQLAALDSAKEQATAWPGPGPKPVTYSDKSDIQGFIDQLKAFWALQDEAARPKPPAPPAVPAGSDAWTQVDAGTIITEGGQSFEVRDTPFGKMKFLVRATAAQPSVATERAAYVDYIKSRVSITADLEAQAELMELLDWLSYRK